MTRDGTLLLGLFSRQLTTLRLNKRRRSLRGKVSQSHRCLTRTAADRRALCLASIVVIGLPLVAGAQESPCETVKQIRGAVSSVTISEVKVRRSNGELIGKPRITETWTYDSDNLKVTIVEHSVDWPGQDLPTTVCEYDAGGHVIRKTIRYGKQVQMTTTWRYDSLRRVIAVETRGRSPSQSFTITYEYAPDTVTERYPNSSAGYYVRYFDGSGAIVKQVHHHADPARRATTTEFRRSPRELEKCWSGGEPPGCITQRFDTWGNVIESSSSFGDKVATSYEIDSMGNWTMRKMTPLASRFGLTELTFDSVVLREIAYRDR